MRKRTTYSNSKNSVFTGWLDQRVNEILKKRVYGSKKELVEAAGISTAAFYFYKNGQRFPRGEALHKLAKVLDVEPEVIEQFKYQREKRKEYVVAEDELEGFVDKRVGENIDLVVEKIISRLQPNYEDISRKLQGIEDDYKSLRKTYDSLMDAHTRLLQKYLEER